MDYIPETETETEEYVETYSAFWPLVILMTAILIWSGYQVYAINAQRIALNAQFDSVAQQVVQSQNAKSKLYSVAQDLIQLSPKNANAAAIVREANIHVTDNSTATPPAK